MDNLISWDLTVYMMYNITILSSITYIYIFDTFLRISLEYKFLRIKMFKLDFFYTLYMNRGTNNAVYEYFKL